MAVDTNEMAGTITSSPGPMPATASIISSDTVPLNVETPYRAMLISRELLSNCPTIS